MKKIFKLIAIVAVIGFTMIACNKSSGSSGNDSSKSSGGGGKSLNSPEALKEYLDSQPANSPNNPIKVSMGANELMLPKIRDVLNSAGKYVSLNLTGNALTTIPKEAFKSCETLVSVTIPNSVTSVEDDVFRNCENLTSATIGNGVTRLEGTGLLGKDLILSSDNNSFSLQDGVLYNKNKTALISYPRSKTGAFNIPNSVTSIEYGAFAGCTGLTSITIPNSVTSIEYGAFAGCTGLTSITIPNSVTSIGSRAFSHCTSLTSVTIPVSVTTIGPEAFDNCWGLTSVTFQGTIGENDFFQAFDNSLLYEYRKRGPGTYTRNDIGTWKKQ